MQYLGVGLILEHPTVPLNMACAIAAAFVMRPSQEQWEPIWKRRHARAFDRVMTRHEEEEKEFYIHVQGPMWAYWMGCPTSTSS